MPFDPELQAHIDALRGGKPDSEEARLKAKLLKRDGQPGYAANVDAIRAKLSASEGE